MDRPQICLSAKDFVGILNSAHHKKGKIVFRAKGSSMAPFIKDGDLLTISPVTFHKLLGKIVVCLDDSQKSVMVHRVIGKTKNGYLLKGDNLNFDDGPRSGKTIKGVVESIERKNKKIILGIGPERIAIAILSRVRILLPILKILRSCKKVLFFNQT